MKFLFLPLVLLAVSCTSKEEKVIQEHLEKSMNLATSNLEIDKITVGEKIEAKPEQKQNLALLGLKDSYGYPVTVSFKAKTDCVAIAEAIKNDIIFNEKKVSCRAIKEGEKPNLKYVKAYQMMGFRTVPIYEEGKLIKAGETFSAKGELVYMTSFKDETKSGTVFQQLN